MPFKTLRLIQPLLDAIQTEGYTIPTAIQQEAIPHVLEGRDLMGCAQTGTGKTAAFALPILQRLHGAGGHHAPRAQAPHAHASAGQHAPAGQGERFRPIRALVVTPTRELAAQIGESFHSYGRHTGLRHAVIYGGVSQGPQTRLLHRGVDILVATPGRLLDLLNQGVLTLRDVQIFVLDEADRMLDMGFIHDIRRLIAQLPTRRQTLMFSATMPDEIRQLAGNILRDPVQVKVASESPAADTVKQALYFVDPQSKSALLEHLLKDPAITRALVFTRTKHGANKVVRRLSDCGIGAEAIHSNKSQNARLRALANFRSGQTRVLVASDIAARGLDVEGISHVINYDLPNVAETYVHRIGRTGRAGACGEAISFCCEEQRDDLHEIERLLGNRIPVLSHGFRNGSETGSVPAGQSGQDGPARQAGQGHRGQRRGGPGQGKPASGAPRKKPASPEQQKDQFWKARRKTGPTSWSGSARRKRRRR